MRWAERQLEERGGEIIIVARFIPGGRHGGHVVRRRPRDSLAAVHVFDAIAAVIWASYAALLGYFGGSTFEDAPWKGLIARAPASRSPSPAASSSSAGCASAADKVAA